jgi:hypothetical protein
VAISTALRGDIVINFHGKFLPLIRGGSMFSGMMIAAFIPNSKSVMEFRNNVIDYVGFEVFTAVVMKSTRR